MTALLLAALSAVLYGAGIAFEHRQAARLPTEAAGRPRMLALLARQPLWLAGAALETGGFVTHAAALRTGSLAAVQMVLSCSLLVSIAVSSGLARRTLPRHCWPAILAIVTAVGAILTLLGPDDHAAGQAPGRLGLAALVTGVITVPIAAAGLLATSRRTRALLLAVAAGLADTCAAVVTMAFTHSLAHGLGAAVTSWPPYALIVAGLASLALAQTAYQTDAPLITLPTITAVMPLASLAVGIVALHETAHLNGARIVIMMACLAVAITALAGLARAGAAVADDALASAVGQFSCREILPTPSQKPSLSSNGISFKGHIACQAGAVCRFVNMETKVTMYYAPPLRARVKSKTKAGRNTESDVHVLRGTTSGTATR
jgi:hypothetical protein